MKLVSLYSNNEAHFPTINFHAGLNVVFAKVESPEAKEKDSHNLGKTLLISVLDFTLLGSVEKDHPFKEHSSVFADFTFYLQIESNFGKFITVKRKVSGNRPVSIHTALSKEKNLNYLADERWEFSSLGIDSARATLDEIFNLTVLAPYNYRKGLGYVLRRQNDYEEVFKISRFRAGADRDWKPFMATLLGFDHELVKTKYDIEATIKSLEQARDVVRKEAGSKKEEFDEIRGEIEIKTASLERSRRNLDTFSFQEIESEIGDDVISRIESELSELNERRYVLDYEIQEIQQSLESRFEFDLERITSIFEETRLVFPDNLKKRYEELIEFNERLSVGRVDRLRNLSQRLANERTEIQARIRVLDSQRASALSILREKETFDKFKKLQNRLSEQEREVSSLHRKLEQLGRASSIQQEINEERKGMDSVIEKIQVSVHGENTIYSTIRRTFSEYVERILNVQALIYVNVNQYGNLEFNVRTLDQGSESKETSEGRGTSYRKILCACFDLALLNTYASKSFYRFVYHDGIFEGLDNRKKGNLLELVRELCAENKLQYILTVIDSDLPRDSIDQKQFFEEKEIVRQLHDRGDTGRLFKMPAF